MNNLKKYLSLKSDRTKNIVKHIGWSSFYKIGSVLINFLLVPLTINYLDKESYGIWLTLSSFISWFSFFDIGLGNGLRNKFTEAKAKGKYKLAKIYISNAYYTISAIAIGLITIFVIINNFVNWSALFNTNSSLRHDLQILMPLIIGFFGIQLVLKLITTIYTADQQHSAQGKIDFFTKLISIIAIWLLLKTSESSLLLFGIIFSFLPVLILFIFNIIAFTGRYKAYKPDLGLWKRKYVSDIMNVGFNFFIIQIAVIILFTTDNLIITKLFGPAEVVPYTIAYKYYTLIIMAYSIIIAPYWSSFSDAYAKREYNWIKKSVQNIQRIWLVIPFLLGIMLLISNWFFKLWVGDTVKISYTLSISMIVYVLFMTYQMIYVQFINGIGKIKLQLIISIISILINIPLSIFLSKFMKLGLSGVILATSFSLLISVILWPIQYKKLINGTARGIWNK
ncbi:MATE family efflux transporter [Cellulophaga sp. HaHa_2_95]|uniref:lipopolysaccharide biosynthesis protein n=1 Tax=unclassified Cellulophaga TaxID=2634405 RepID=UPI001C4FE116|nr:MATE family efflux transporter [Cellulophaga sp. HaHa_2_95]QXP56900.1 MATE family efflux transporter [Cellulophaga sp. HaHa_2_95]